MRILVVGRCWPSREGKFVRSANVLIHELLVGLAQRADVTVGYLHVLLDGETAVSGGSAYR